MALLELKAIGTPIIGFDGFSEYNGVIEELSVIDHSVLGVVKQVWVRWKDGCKAGWLEPYSPHQIERHIPGNRKIGVYFAG